MILAFFNARFVIGLGGLNARLEVILSAQTGVRLSHIGGN